MNRLGGTHPDRTAPLILYQLSCRFQTVWMVPYSILVRRMRRHRTLLILTFILVVAATAGVIVYERIARPARAVLLLPEGNFLLYVNFSPAHFFDLGQMAIQSDPEYQEFLQQTGFHFEHDLDSMAISQRNPGDLDSESSAILTGHFDQDRVSSYLKKLSVSTENYADKTIYLFHNQDHVVRACVLDANTVAVTNMPSAEPMHSIIDKSRNPRLIGNGPFLVENYYRHVPLGSLAWAMFRAPSTPGSQLPGGMNVDFLQNTVSVASLRYTGSIRFRLEVLSENEADAKRVVEAANTFLVLGRGASESLKPGGPDKDVKAVFDSIQVQQTGNVTVVTITIPQEFVQKLAASLNH